MQHHLSQKEAREIYLAKCEVITCSFKLILKDLFIQPTSQREERFMTILNRNCSGDSFDLRDTGIGEKAGKTIARVLQRNNHYTSLHLAGNFVRTSGAEALSELILKNPTITFLDLRSNDIGIKGGTALFKALGEESCALEELDLSGLSGLNRNHIGPSGAETLQQVLPKTKTLRRLALRENGLGPEGATAIAQGLRNNLSLHTLDVAANRLGAAGVSALCDAALLSNVQWIGLARNGCGDGGAKAVAMFLSGIRRLRGIDLARNEVTAVGAKAIGDALRGNDTLTSLVLDRNALGSAGVRQLADALRENNSLTELRLSHNNIEARGAQELADALKNHKSLTKLDLGHNLLGDEGATAFGLMLKWNRTIISLDISSNKIGHAGGSDFAQNLHFNSTLQNLSMRNNSMIEATGEVLANYLRSNDTLLSLDISFNDMNYKHICILEKKIKENVKKYKAAAVDRYKKEISHLHLTQNRLVETEHRLEQERAVRAREEAKVQEKLKQLEIAEEHEQERVKDLKESITEHVNLVSKTEAKQVSLSHEASKIRAEKEARYWSLVQKLHKEKDNNNRLEKRIRAKKQQLEELKMKNTKEISSLDEQLRLRLFDRNQAETDYRELEEQITTLRAKLEESAKEPPKDSRSSRRTKRVFPAIKGH